MMPRRAISTVIIAQNEEAVIRRAVQSCIPFSDEILVVDGGSLDSTVETAERAGARVVLNAWPGFAKQRNFAAQSAQNDWIFFLDSDEIVDADLQASLLEWRVGNDWGKHALACYRVNEFLGDALYHGEWKVRLYNKQFVHVDDVKVHEMPNVRPDLALKLDGKVLHYGFTGLSDLLTKFNTYTSLEAVEKFERGVRFSITRLFGKPILRILQRLFLHQQWRSGLRGLAFAFVWVIYDILVELKILELELNQRASG